MYAGRVVMVLALSACGRVEFGRVPTSCISQHPTCGADGDEDCCESPLLPGGTYYRSYDLGTDGMYKNMNFPATLAPYRLDKYEVTVARFRAFVDAGMGTQARPPTAGAGARTLNGVANQAGWDPTWDASLAPDTASLIAALGCNAHSWTDVPLANEALPINCLTWQEAFAFCAWDGGFMPTDAEWNYAATGGDEQRAYPWSTPASSLAIDCTYANYSGCAGRANRVGSESPTGDGRWGHADMSGNIEEFTLDWYNAAYTDPCDGCANLTPGTKRTSRAGSYSHSAQALRAAYRNGGIVQTGRAGDEGVRCARPP